MIIVYTWYDAEETSIDYVINTNCDLDVLAGDLLKEADNIRDAVLFNDYEYEEIKEVYPEAIKYIDKYGMSEDYEEIATHVFNDAGYEITFEDFAVVQRGSI